VNNHKIF